MRKRVYVMAPFRAPTEMQRQHNIMLAKKAGVGLARHGFAPVVPHAAVAFYYDELPETQMMDICLSLLQGCHAAVVLATSVGVRQEIEFAERNTIPVHLSVEELLAAQKIQCHT